MRTIPPLWYRSSSMARLRRIGWALGGFLVFAGGSAIASDVQELLDQGWAEYAFQSFDEARRQFTLVDRGAGDKASRRQARLGLAMVDQFRESKGDPRRAIDAYRDLRKEDANDEVAVMATSFLAEALVALGNLDEANILWDQVITEHADDIAAQDALLRRTVANLAEPGSDQTLEAVRYLEEQRRRFPPPTQEQPGLAPTMDLLLGDIYFYRGEHEKARAAYMRYVDVATVNTTSYPNHAILRLKIALLSERFLNDPETAGEYYRRLVLDTPNDQRSWFALEQAVRYGTLTRREIEALELNGVTPEILDELMEGTKH